jgi:hypothetical protein
MLIWTAPSPGSSQRTAFTRTILGNARSSMGPLRFRAVPNANAPDLTQAKNNLSQTDINMIQRCCCICGFSEL